MDESNDEAHLGLDLGLGLNDCKPKKRERTAQYDKRTLCLDFSIPLHTSGRHRESSSSLKVDVMKGGLCENNNESKGWMDNFGCRKKLRLTRDQTTLLEDSFKQHPTLNTAQKQAIAEKLNLKPRQVEVWFQNRRARTKLKQTEADCEFLRGNCERLSEENWRLKKELFELRSSLKVENVPPPPPAAARIFHHKARAAPEKYGKNRGGSEEKEAAMEVVHGNENLIGDTAKNNGLNS